MHFVLQVKLLFWNAINLAQPPENQTTQTFVVFFFLNRKMAFQLYSNDISK